MQQLADLRVELHIKTRINTSDDHKSGSNHGHLLLLSNRDVSLPGDIG